MLRTKSPSKPPKKPASNISVIKIMKESFRYLIFVIFFASILPSHNVVIAAIPVTTIVATIKIAKPVTSNSRNCFITAKTPVLALPIKNKVVRTKIEETVLMPPTITKKSSSFSQAELALLGTAKSPDFACVFLFAKACARTVACALPKAGRIDITAAERLAFRCVSQLPLKEILVFIVCSTILSLLIKLIIIVDVPNNPVNIGNKGSFIDNWPNTIIPRTPDIMKTRRAQVFFAKLFSK